MASGSLLTTSSIWPPPSQLTTFISTNLNRTSPLPEDTSTISTAGNSITGHGPRNPSPNTAHNTEIDHLQALALQIQHQLTHQHSWTDVRLHTHFESLDEALDSSSHASRTNPPSSPLPRPLLTGLPPRPLYVHPDIQTLLIKSRLDESSLPTETVVVCPAHIREGNWTLERLSAIMDSLPFPSRFEGEAGTVFGSQKVNGKSVQELDRNKRVLLAVTEDDSTTVYYWVHDGLVKPRQN